jgi:mannose-1-phosphate guanylyltransferase/mannose-1-phosphate guanylyltransferase/mannose-6-phosphate isomerase
MTEASPIIPVIMCGGTGTRLWPLSREAYPKQFLQVVGNQTLLQQTVMRVADRERFGRPMIVTNEDHRFIVAEQLREVGLRDAVIIVEPEGRNTAPAAAVAALHAREQDPDALILLLAADHVIADTDAFLDAVFHGAEAAAEGRIILFGIEPTFAAKGYGYIQKGDLIQPGLFEAARFVEKPDQATAQVYCDSKLYVWNSGMFLTTARHLLAELAEYCPDVVAAATAALVGGDRDLDFLRLGKSFRDAPSVSLDYGLMERTDKAALIPLSCGWSDLGSWSSLWDVGDKSPEGNVVAGEVVLEKARGCYLRGEGPMVVAIGVEDLVVVATDDVVLVANKNCDQEIKHIVKRLKDEGCTAAVSPRRVYRPWGFYESVLSGHRFQVKRITVNPGGKLSLQKHFHRAEHWVVVNGTALVTRDDEQLIVRENESVYLPLGAVHRLENPGKLPLNLIEVQSGAYLQEDDIVRLEDVYQRT